MSDDHIITRRLLRQMSSNGITAALNLNIGALRSRNIRIHGRRTSIRLDDRMWLALNEISEKEKYSIHEICSIVNDYKDRDASLSTALRVFIMNYYRISSEDNEI